MSVQSNYKCYTYSIKLLPADMHTKFYVIVKFFNSLFKDFQSCILGPQSQRKRAKCCTRDHQLKSKSNKDTLSVHTLVNFTEYLMARSSKSACVYSYYFVHL